MNKKIPIGIIVVLVIAVAALSGPLPLVVWIFLVWMVLKKKNKIFYDQMEPKLAERYYKMLKAFLLVAGISFVMIWVSILLGSYVFHLSAERMDTIILPIAFSFLGVFNISSIGGLVIFLKGRRIIS
jgi:hypothetical protein